MFAVLLYNIWRLTDFLLKAGVDGERDYTPVLTAGECVDLVSSLADVLLKATVLREITDYTSVITAEKLADWIAIHL